MVNDVAWSLPSDNAVWDPTVGRSTPDATDGLYGPFNKVSLLVSLRRHVLSQSSSSRICSRILVRQPEMYHPRCAIDYNNDTSVQYCTSPIFLPLLTPISQLTRPLSILGWIGEPAQTVLPDLNTESSAVRQLLYDHIKNLVSTYQIDGIRIDAAKHVNFDFWSGFQAAAGTFTMGEVLDGGQSVAKISVTA